MAGQGMSEWAQIREGANEVEKLIGQKQYNLAMIKSRQTLEYMVRCLAERNSIQYGDLSDTIDRLYKARVISKTTAEHYHKIRMIGNKAAHEGGENASGANTAYHLLSQELYTFASDFSPRTVAAPAYAPQENRREDYDRPPQKRKTGGKKKVNAPELIFKIMIPVLAILLIFAVVRLIMKFNTKEEVPEPTEMQIEQVETTAYVPVTQAPAPTTEAPKPIQVWVTNDVLNVRSEPTTEGENKVGQLQPGTQVEYIEDYDAQWAKIKYNDMEAYVAKQYLTMQELNPDGTPVTGAGGAVPAEGAAEGGTD